MTISQLIWLLLRKSQIGQLCMAFFKNLNFIILLGSGEVEGNLKDRLLKKNFNSLWHNYLTFGFCNSCFGRLGQMHFWIRIQEIILNPNALNILKITREIVDCELNNNFQTVVEIWNILAKCIRKFQKFSCWNE